MNSPRRPTVPNDDRIAAVPDHQPLGMDEGEGWVQGQARWRHVYAGQSRQLEEAYALRDPVSWRRHPLSPLTPGLLSHAALCSHARAPSEVRRLTLLDLGCGGAEKSNLLRALGANIVGVDILWRPLDQARAFISSPSPTGSLVLVQADVRALPFRSHAFDGAQDYLSFLHVIPTDWSAYVDSAAEVLKPGAPLLLVTFSGNDPDFYGYPIRDLADRGIVFSAGHYGGDRSRIDHLVGSYFYFPTEHELYEAWSRQFDVLQVAELPHPMHADSQAHSQRKLWHVLMRKR